MDLFQIFRLLSIITQHKNLPSIPDGTTLNICSTLSYLKSRDPLVAVNGRFIVLAPGRNFVLSLVVSLAHSLKLYK